jgi:ferrochelatase
MELLRTGVVLVNLGTPDSPRVGDVRRYLREFLSDPLVIDLPAPARKLLVEGVILPRRPRTSAAAYAKIWTPQGSPLLVHGRALRDALAAELGPGYVVELAMRYGTPSIRGALARLAAADVARMLVLPLFPQFARATTGSVAAKLEQELALSPELPPHDLLPPFFADPGFVEAWTRVARPELEAFAPDFVLMSYHGLPERQVRASDASGAHCLARSDCCDALGAENRHCYRAHCFATSRALAAALGLAPDRTATSFQSRLGPTAWIRPYTDKLLPELVAAGHRRLAVLCPAFVADCLETLEEIGIRARERWHELGGDELHLVPSLNAHPAWVGAVAHWVRSRA